MSRTTIWLLTLIVAIPAALAGCGRRVSYYRSPPIDGVRFHARAALAGPASDTLRVHITAINGAPEERTLEFSCGASSARLITRAPGRSRMWDYSALERHRQQAVRRDSVTGTPIIYIGCVGGLHALTLAPGDSAAPFGLIVPVRDVLGDSLPPGRYGVTARVSVGGRLVDHLEANDVELAAPPT